MISSLLQRLQTSPVSEWQTSQKEAVTFNSKTKSMALKLVNDVNVGGFDDERSAIEIAYLAKNFRNFLRNNNRRARDKNTIEPRNFRKNDPTKANNTE